MKKEVKHFRFPMTSKVSMNFWCFDPSVFTFIEKIFKEFLAKRRTGIQNRNFLFPSSETGLFTKVGVR